MDDRVITSAGSEYLPRTVSVISKVFETDPVIVYLLNSQQPVKRNSYLPTYFSALFTAASLNKGVFYEIDDWKCSAILMPPGEKVDNPMTWFQSGIIPVLWNIGFSGIVKMVGEYSSKADKAKNIALKGQKKYYYVFIIGTELKSQRKGLASTLMKHFQAIAAKDKVPLWLEATTASSRDLYLRIGFEISGDEIVLGKGKAAADGTAMDGGEGVTIWPMVWWPPA